MSDIPNSRIARRRQQALDLARKIQAMIAAGTTSKLQHRALHLRQLAQACKRSDLDFLRTPEWEVVSGTLDALYKAGVFQQVPGFPDNLTLRQQVFKRPRAVPARRRPFPATELRAWLQERKRRRRLGPPLSTATSRRSTRNPHRSSWPPVVEGGGVEMNRRRH
jgi:hypothetical protein